ncbi:MAG TPA: DUF305 domain-containing protein [Acidimicrobiia bacterium]|nr:DUF305 domain-containing protein [Acidimicrobiia bacterium]
MPRNEESTATEEAASPDRGHAGEEGGTYLRFGAMIATSMVVMYGVMYLNTFEVAHVRWSETRMFMTLLMGSTMAIIMLGFMLGMYKNRRANLAIVAVSLIIFGLGTWLVRSQTTVEESSYMSAMIPHHSIAILTSERSQIDDVRVCELAVEIVKAQRREIAEMEWLIEDIDENGAAASAEQAEQRPVPTFEGSSSRTCP